MPRQQLPVRTLPSSVFLVVLCLVLWCPAFIASAGQPLVEGDQAPDWILSDSRGETVSFYRDSDGQKSVLLFWATWCPYCAELMPELEQLRQELANQTISFYALNIWEDGDPIEHMKQHGFGFQLLLNADNVAQRYKVNGTPALFVVGEDKTIHYVRKKGASAEAVAAAVKETLTSVPTE